MIVFDIHSRLRAGKLVLGTSREMTRNVMAALNFVLTHSSNSMDYYDENSIQLDFFDDDCLHFIGFAYSPNFDVAYGNVDPFDSEAKELFRFINENEIEAIPFNDYDPLFPTQIIALWDAQEQYDYKGGHRRPIFATFSMGDQRYLDEMIAIKNGG
ncbi:hypothetical protein SH449x_002189 [Pirellulaceae bacterium SH449]